jgi:hypothetical protein
MPARSTKSTESTKYSRSTLKTNPYDLLDEFGKNMVNLKLTGWKYERLVTVAKKAEQTIRTWFMEDGQYHAAYIWRRNQLLDEATKDFDDAEFHLKQGVADAVVVLKTEVAKKNWKAAVALLKMVGFDVQKVILKEESEGTKILKKLITKRRHAQRQTRPVIQAE